MNQSPMQSMSREQHLQHYLQHMVEQLRWSYVALWSLNHETRNLGWKGGHFRVNSSGTEVWNAQLFDSTYKSCHFTGNGSVVKAHSEGRNIWLNGPLVLNHAGSKEQAEFLQHARIATALCIPWADGVLELGTSESVCEDLKLVENIRKFLVEIIIPALGQPSVRSSLIGVSQAPPCFSKSSIAPRTMVQQHAPFTSVNTLRSQTSENLSSVNFEPNSLNQQIRRTASLSSMSSDMFLYQPEDGTEGKDPVGSELDKEMWRLPTRRTGDSLPVSAIVPAPQEFQYYPPAQQSARGQYRSRTSTTSSSVSSLEESSAKHSVDSPEQNNRSTFYRASSQRRTSNSTTSSSPKRGTSSHSPEMNQFEDVAATNTALEESAREDDDIQKAILMFEGVEDPDQHWRSICSHLETDNASQMNLLECSTNGSNHANSSFHAHVLGNEPQTGAQGSTSPQGPFKSWRHTRILAPILQKSDRTNQELLRRCIDIMKQIPSLQQGLPANQTETAGQAVVQSEQAPRVPSSSSPQVVPDNGIAHDPFDQPGPPLRGQRRPRGGSRIASMGPVHSGHDDAAMNHMMAERRRRVKQKENFAALRRLVPIISKADKASILGDAIVYLKDLQEQIKELEASRDETQRRFESLQVSYKDLDQRNKELEAMAQQQQQLRGSARGLIH